MMTMRLVGFAGLVLASLIGGISNSARATDSIVSPQGTVILSVSGNVAATNAGDRADFDHAMLEAMGPRMFESFTPWTDGVQTFEGIALQTLLDRIGADGDSIEAVALNDYSATLPMTDVEEYDVAVVWSQNGKRLSVRDKGPLWIIYPHPDGGENISDIQASRMVWQLRTLRVE